MSYFACHVKKFKSNDVRGLQIHNQRESSNSKNNDIDPYRTILNYDLHNKDKINYNQRVKEIIAEGYKGAKAIRKDATVMTSTIVTSDKGFFDKLSLKEQRLFFEESYKFLKECYGEKNIVSAVVHMDETTPHMHLTAVPLTEDGKLSAKTIIDRKFLRHIQKAIPELLKSKGFDIERGVEGSAKGHTDTDEYKKEQLKKLKDENQELKRQNLELRKGYPNDTLRNWDNNNKLRRKNKELTAENNILKIQKKAMSEFIGEKGLGEEAELVVREKIYEKTNAPKTQQRSNNYQVGD
ncbi:MobV family relaxase [Clostridium sp.]|uniref:MobV family relaxase n=1 Tax=Clostridium sp. TaxID=1506 RepID=UPI00399103EF